MTTEETNPSPIRRLPRAFHGPSAAEAVAGAAPVPAPALRLVGEEATVAHPQEQQALAVGIPFERSLAGHQVSMAYLERFPIAFSRRHRILGFCATQENGPPWVALCHLQSWPQLDLVGRILGVPVQGLLATEKELLDAINAAYQSQTGQAQEFLNALDDTHVISDLTEMATREDLLDVSGRAPVIQLVNLILFEAVQSRASDVHLQPYEDRMVVRCRIDGILSDTFDVPKDMQEEVLSRVKILGKMNIAEKRLPQDGRATVKVGDRLIDLRIASLPASHGERVVIRLLDKSARLYSLSEIGMDDVTLLGFRKYIHVEHGLVLVTGPTGSGKSTTLYGSLQEINTKDRNVVTLEDPIEYEITGISQTQINEKKGLTFAKGLRNVLRQDPDIIMVGEIRDQETAIMGIQSALTGHLVFSTLHTNDAASAVTRLLDLGIEPYLVSSSLLAVMAQRLVRRVCPQCLEWLPLTDEQRRNLESFDLFDRMPQGRGCEACRQTGYRGRVGIFELLQVNDEVRDRIQARANATEIRQTGIRHGMRLLREDGLLKVVRGMTTLEEVERVTMRTSI